MKQIYFTVTNDLSFDQRMHRICGSLANNGFGVTLIGRKKKDSPPLQQKSFRQKRLKCLFNAGPLFYAEYNFKLFFYLLFQKIDGICAIDLDTILPCLCISKLKRVPRIYDAHEYFTELKEVRTRPIIKKIWLLIERITVPRFIYGYSVSDGLVKSFKTKYGRDYLLVRNLPLLRDLPSVSKDGKFILYQGAVNEARGLEYLIPAMTLIDYRLVICGDGNFMPQVKELIQKNNLQSKVELKGMVLPDELLQFTPYAALGVGLSEKEGLNQYYGLPNKFFDYMHAAVPQIAMNYPEYSKINNEFKVAVLLDKLSVEEVGTAISGVLNNDSLRREMEENCRKASKIYCWQNEENTLIDYYKNILSD